MSCAQNFCVSSAATFLILLRLKPSNEQEALIDWYSLIFMLFRTYELMNLEANTKYEVRVRPLKNQRAGLASRIKFLTLQAGSKFEQSLTHSLCPV